MDEENYYDEFGNYIGPEVTEESVENENNVTNEEEEEEEYYNNDGQVTLATGASSTSNDYQVILHEDKKYYPSAEEVYGEGVEVVVQEEDTQLLTEPIIAPIKEILVEKAEATGIPSLKYSLEFMRSLAGCSERNRNVMIAGSIHHGKTSLIDTLIAEAHEENPSRNRLDKRNSVKVPQQPKLPKYLDSLVLEGERGISLRSKPISLVLPDSHGCSYLFNILDTPGHADFRQEVKADMDLADGIVLVVDCLEGPSVESEEILKAALEKEKKVLLVLSKMERLWMEVKLPPTDAYYKLKHSIDKLNTLIEKEQGIRGYFRPECGNVCFASVLTGWSFNLKSFAQIYTSFYPEIPANELAKRLWGDLYFDSQSGSFHRKPTATASKRSFVTFCLEPLYKLYTQLLSEDDSSRSLFSSELGINLNKLKYLSMDVKPLLKLLLGRFFDPSVNADRLSPVQGLIDAMTEWLPAPKIDYVADAEELTATLFKVYPPQKFSTGNNNANSNELEPKCLIRIWKGTIVPGQRVRLFNPLNPSLEESTSGIVESVCFACTRYEIPVHAGQYYGWASWVIISGLPLDTLIPSGVIVADCEDEIGMLARVERVGMKSTTIPSDTSFLKVSIEPMIPSELPKMLNTLRLLSVVYPSLKTRVEESGEHVLYAPGELYLDTVLHDLRQLGQVTIRLSDPTVQFNETVQEMSVLKCFAETMNGKLRVTMIAEPLEKGLAEFIELQASHQFNSSNQEVVRVLQEKYGWDKVSARSILAVSGPNVLLDDTFNQQPELLEACRTSLIQGFQWAMREGPLCEEPIRSVKFRLVDIAAMTDNLSPLDLSPAQLVPTARRVCYSAFLTAMPRLLEPVNLVEITAPSDAIEAIYTVLAKRRGHVLSDTPIPATPWYSLQALLPLLDSCGFEVDLRIATQGSAFPTTRFALWQVMPGDPLDTSLPPILLEPAPAPALARDCLLKVRRRRGIGQTVRIDKFFDSPMMAELVREQIFKSETGQ